MPALKEDTTRFLDAWMQVRQIVQASNFNRFQRAGLSATQFMTLNVVPKDGMTLSEIARKLNLSAATLNATVNSLVERGLVRRTPDRTDARKVIIRATRRSDAELCIEGVSYLHVEPVCANEQDATPGSAERPGRDGEAQPGRRGEGYPPCW